MTIVRRVARPLLAAAFVQDGVAAARKPAARSDAARPVVAQVAAPLHLPQDPELLVRANGGAQAGAGVLFALGRLPRLTGLVLAVTMAFTTLTTSAYWTQQDPVARARQREQFLANLSLIGAALLASVDTQGRPGLAWRTRRAGQDTARAARAARRDAKRAARTARREARIVAGRASVARLLH